jgi:serine phosphatase RsbU (regulator of sigma subunit)
LRAALHEVGAAACAVAAGWGAGLALAGAGSPAVRWGAAVGLGLGLCGLQVALRAATGRPQGGPSVEEAEQVRRFLDECAAGAIESRDRVERVADGLRRLLGDEFRLLDVQVLTDEAIASLDPRVRAWLIANGAPIAVAQLDERRLGGLREPVIGFLASLAADLVMPLVHRDRLVGVIAARGRAGRLVSGQRGSSLRSVQQAAAGALGELRRRAEADQQADVTKEVDAAATVQRATAPATIGIGLAGCHVVRHYAPARQFSGAWWCARELPDGRLFAGMGEVTGRGVGAALVSATAMGVCEAATQALGSGVELHGILELLDGSVRGVSRGSFAMSAVLALVDREKKQVTFSGAGHPFPYLVRPSRQSRGGPSGGSLRALVSRGTHIGAEDRPIRSLGSEAIAAGDVLVFFTASLTDARDENGRTLGERTLQHLLRRASLVGPVAPDGADLVDQIAEQAAGHLGGQPPDQDILIATVEVL